MEGRIKVVRGFRSTMIRLEPMSRRQFHESVERAIPRHAHDNVRRGIWTDRAALEESRREFEALLPNGPETPGHHFCTIVNEADGVQVGETWYSVQEKGGKVLLWVDWIWIEPQFRRQGHASEALLALGARASALGADRMGLSVTEDNVAAKALYAKLGFRPWLTRLVRDLTRSSSP